MHNNQSEQSTTESSKQHLIALHTLHQQQMDLIQTNPQDIPSKQIGIGGEGTLLLYQTQPPIVIKKFTDSTEYGQKKRDKKIQAMVDNAPEYFAEVDTALAALHIHAAWPTAYTKNADGTIDAIAMEYIPGIKLSMLLPNIRKLDLQPEAICDIAKRVALGMYCLWQHGIFFYDINKDNIMVDPATGIITFIDTDGACDIRRGAAHLPYLSAIPSIDSEVQNAIRDEEADGNIWKSDVYILRNITDIVEDILKRIDPKISFNSYFTTLPDLLTAIENR